MASRSLTESLRETLALFDGSGKPWTTTEVAERLDLGRRSTYERLERLADHGRLETKKVGASARVWWRPPSVDRTTAVRNWPAAAESLIDAVEEYAIFLLDADGYVRTWNAGAERIKGYGADEILGEHFSTFYTEEDRTAGVPDANLARAAEEGSTEDEGWRVRADGSRFWANVTITAVRDDGDLDGFVKVTRDMTDRRKREQQLRYERNLVEQIIETAPVGIGVFSATGETVRANRRAEEFLDATRDDSGEYGSGRQRIFSVDGDLVPPDEQPTAQVVKTGEPLFDWQCQIERPDGERRWLSLNAAPLGAADGDIDRVIVAGEDVTQFKEQARRLERQRDDLERELDEVFDRITDGFYGLDEHLRFTYVNDRAEALLGLAEPSVVGQDVREAIPLTDPFEAAIEEALDHQRPVFLEDYYEPLDAWFENAIYPSETGVSVYFRDVTERKEREQELERYAGIFDAVGDAVYELDARGRITFVNDAFVEQSGYEESELLGEHVSMGMDEEAVERAESKMVDLLAGGPEGTVTLEYEVITRDGERIPVENRISLLTDEDGGIRGSAGVLRDVTERKERQRELEQYETIVETIEDGVYVVDEAGEFVFVNDAYCEQTGYAREQLLGADASLVADEETIARAREQVAKFRDGEIDEMALEADLHREDGTRLPAEATFALLPGDEEMHRIGVVRDVTERKERERELEESERRYRTLVENFPNGIVTLFDEDLRYLVAGGDLYDAFDKSPDETVGETLHERSTPEEVELLEPHYRAALDGETHTFETEYAGRTIRFWTVPVTDEDGDVFAGMAMSQDVTERIERERELERQREQLAALNDINEVVHEITDAVIDQSTREEIEAAVCERLAASDSYLFAWIGDVDVASETVTLRTEAGVSGYLDGVTITVDPDDEHSEGPTGRALRTGEVQTTGDVRDDPRHDPWREHVEEHGFRSSAAIPIVHEGTTYGVLNVYAGRPSAFEGQEREVIGQLGEVVGHAIAATERKRALMSDEVVELEFRVQNIFDALDADHVPAGTITLDHAVPVEDGEYLVYGTATADAVESVRTLVEELPHWTDVTFREDDGDTGFELHLSEPPVLSAVASLGGSVERVVFQDGDTRMTIHLSPSADVRRLIDAVQEAYPAAEMVKRRQVARRDDPAGQVERVLSEELTERQRAALDAAYHAGFFEWPRGATGEDLADSLGVAPATFHQHLRTAEGKVFSSLLSTPAPT